MTTNASGAPGARPNLNSTRLQPAYDVIRRFVDDGQIPGAVAVIGTSDVTLPPFAYGAAAWEPVHKELHEETIYDCASLTKVVVTTTLTLMMIDDGHLHLDLPVGRVIPEFVAEAAVDPHFSDTVQRLTGQYQERTCSSPRWAAESQSREARTHITVRHLLTHTAGLSAWRPLYKYPEPGPEGILAALCRSPLESLPGSTVSYSCLGFILLGVLLERLSGTRLDALAHERVFSPLQMVDSGFTPALERHDRIAPTEKVGESLIHGVVHDENARAMGGVSGNAGLFSTAPDLARFAQMILQRPGEGPRLLSSSAIASATRNHTSHLDDEPRGLGWLLHSGSGSPGGDLFGPRSFGHTGFTGTSLWLDPDRDLFVVLLTNRVHPSRDNPAHLDLRPLFHNAVAAALL